MEKISELLKNTRKKFGYTLDQVSKKTGIAVATIHAWERDVSKPRAHNRSKIAFFYSIPEESLMVPDTETDQLEVAKRAFLAQHESRVVMLRKTTWADADSLVKKLGAHDINHLLDQLISEMKTQGHSK